MSRWSSSLPALRRRRKISPPGRQRPQARKQTQKTRRREILRRQLGSRSSRPASTAQKFIRAIRLESRRRSSRNSALSRPLASRQSVSYAIACHQPDKTTKTVGGKHEDHRRKRASSLGSAGGRHRSRHRQGPASRHCARPSRDRERGGRLWQVASRPRGGIRGSHRQQSPALFPDRRGCA